MCRSALSRNGQRAPCAAARCSASGNGPLDDLVTPGPGKRRDCVLSVPVLAHTPAGSVTTIILADQTRAGIHAQVSDSDSVVLFRDSLEGPITVPNP